MMNFQVARLNMVAQQVRPLRVINEEVLLALSQIQRENFVPEDFLSLAYSDIAVPIGEGQTMLPPKIVGRALQELMLTSQDKVLEVGTGTGYVTACLTKLVKKVISVEILSTLKVQAEKNLNTINCRNTILEQGDAIKGWEIYAPYDAIFITGSYPLGVPDKICEQLKIPGRLFAIVGVAPSMQAVIIERQGKSDFITHTLFETVVPALIHAAQPQKFEF